LSIGRIHAGWKRLRREPQRNELASSSKFAPQKTTHRSNRPSLIGSTFDAHFCLHRLNPT
jgi:hypothetical protein